MKAFKDTLGREWTIAANIATLSRVKDLAEVDLTDPKSIGSLADDTFVFGQVLYVLCKPEIEQRSLNEESFWEGFDGDVIEAAASALLEELVNFTRPLRRPALRKAIQKKTALEQKV